MPENIPVDGEVELKILGEMFIRALYLAFLLVSVRLKNKLNISHNISDDLEQVAINNNYVYGNIIQNIENDIRKNNRKFSEFYSRYQLKENQIVDLRNDDRQFNIIRRYFKEFLKTSIDLQIRRQHFIQFMINIQTETENLSILNNGLSDIKLKNIEANKNSIENIQEVTTENIEFYSNRIDIINNINTFLDGYKSSTLAHDPVKLFDLLLSLIGKHQQGFVQEFMCTSKQILDLTNDVLEQTKVLLRETQKLENEI